ncbi:MAG: ECF-type sigma factor, partial [Planctomycetota bacterium]
MTSLPTGSVTQWIQDVKSGEGAAAHKLWDAYFDRMVKLANRKLRQASKQEADEEDVAVQALN